MEKTGQDLVQNDNEKIKALMKIKEQIDRKSEELARMIRKLVYAR